MPHVTPKPTKKFWLAALVLALAASCAGASGGPASTTDRPQATAAVVEAGGAGVVGREDLPEPLPAPLPADPMRVTIDRLSNGLTVYISPDSNEPRISAHIVVRAGSRTDPADSTGLAHYLEHMLFKGTTRMGTLDAGAERPHIEKIAALYQKLYAERDPARRTAVLAEIDAQTQASTKWLVPSELDRLTETLGFTGLNAMTSEDWTMYLVDIPRNRLEHWARLEADRFAQPVFRLFLPELEAVYEEKNQSIDSPENLAFEKLMRLLYPKHPYGTQTTIGAVEHLKNPAYHHMLAYYQRFYVPSNMAIVLSGDVDAATAVPVLERHFGQWKARSVGTPAAGELPPLDGRAFQEVKAEGEEQILIGWQTVPAGHPDELAVTVMDLLMADSRSGLINSELVLPQKIPAGGSYPSFMKEAGQWILYGTARDGQRLEEIERLLLETVDKLKAGAFDDKDLAAAILNEDIRDKRELESNRPRAMRMASAFALHQPWPVVADRGRRLRALTKADIVRAANTYLGPGYAVVYRRKGKLERAKLTKPRITPIEMDASRWSPFAKELIALPAPPIEPQYLQAGVDYHRGKLPAGKLIATPNPRNDLFSVSYGFELGHRREPLLCFALDVQQTAGAGGLSAAAFQKQLYALGARVSVTCDADQTEVSVEGVDRFMEETLAWVERWFREPVFDQQAVDTRRATVLTDRRNSLEDPRFAAQALAAYAELGRRSVFLAQPSNAALAKTNAEDVRRLLARFPDHRHKTLYFGPRPLAETAKVLGFGARHRPVAARPPVRYNRPPGPTIYLLDRELAQAQLSLIFPAGPTRRADFGKSVALSHYIGGGMHAVLFQEIREARGLAYAVDGGHVFGARKSDDGGFYGYLATQPDKTAEALGRFLEIVRTVPVIEERLAMTRSAAEEQIRSRRYLPRWVPATVDGWDERGEPGDPRPRLRTQIATLRAPALQAFLRQQAARVFAAGLTAERGRVDLAELGKLGRIQEMKTEDLFSFGPFPAIEAPASASAGTRVTCASGRCN